MATTEETEALYALDISGVRWRSLSDPTGEGVPEITDLPNGAKALRSSSDPDTVLRYTAAEWEAFVLGAKDGEFDLEAPRG